MKSSLLASAVVLVSLLAGAVPVSAAGTSTFLTDTSYALTGGTMVVKAGSSYSSLSVSDDSVTAAIPAGEAFEVRTPGLYPSVVENDGGVAICNVISDRDNRLLVYGPRTVTFRPLDQKCTVISAAYSINTTPDIGFVAPAAGDRLVPGSRVNVFWSNLAGHSPNAVRLRLSTDGGQTFGTVLADGLINSGFYVWEVPSSLSAAHARIKLDAYDSGFIVALAMSGEFAIGDATDSGEEEPAPTETTGSQTLVSYGYDPTAATFAASTIGADLGLSTSDAPAGCVPNMRIKSMSDSAVYYCGVDGRRYVFPNLATHRTWYDDFAGVVELSDSQIASVPLGGNVTYRPGVRLIKIQTDPKVYAVDAGGTLRWLRTEAVAAALYGASWNRLVDDVSDALFVNYTVGDPIGEAL
ncbi:MAG: hypothetical protein ABIJ46_01610 [bacterium]